MLNLVNVISELQPTINLKKKKVHKKADPSI